MPAIKPISDIAEKWARVAPTRQEDYLKGVQSPRTPWEAGATAADGAYKAGVQAAVAQNRFTAGIRAAGNAKWQRKATELGPSRFATGTQAARPDFEKGFGPFRQVIEATTLPPRRPKGDPGNIERVRAMADALRRAKTRA
jgi:hypothetical protein